MMMIDLFHQFTGMHPQLSTGVLHGSHLGYRQIVLLLTVFIYNGRLMQWFVRLMCQQRWMSPQFKNRSGNQDGKIKLF